MRNITSVLPISLLVGYFRPHWQLCSMASHAGQYQFDSISNWCDIDECEGSRLFVVEIRYHHPKMRHASIQLFRGLAP